MNEINAAVVLRSAAPAKVVSVKGPPMRVVACACAGEHLVARTEEGIVYAIGKNADGEIGPEIGESAEGFAKVAVLEMAEVREVCTGEKFTAMITVDGDVVVRGALSGVGNGKEEVFGEFVAPRGMAAGKEVMTFVEERNRVCVWTGETRRFVEVKGDNVVLTEVNDECCVALTGDGKVMVLNLDGGDEFVQVDAGFKVKTVYKSEKVFYFQSFGNDICLFENGVVEPVSLPCDLDVVGIQKINDLTAFLDSAGRITYTGKYGQRKKNCEIPLPDFKVSSFCACEKFIMFFRGVPKCPKSAPPIKYHCAVIDELLIRRNHERYHLIGFDSDNSYTREKNFYHSPFEFLNPDLTIEFKNFTDKTICFTSSNKIISITSDFDGGFRYNFIKNDIVTTESGVNARFIGFYEGRVWVKLLSSKYVFSPVDPSLLTIKERPGHKLYTCVVDDQLSKIDITPSFCEKFGYSIGDLIWYPKKGIVKFIGIYANKYVFMNYADFSLFSSEIMPFKLIRTFNDKNQHFRNVLTSKGKNVKLNVCCKKCIFYPGDRVYSTKLGDSTFLGVDEEGNSYIQSDEMKMADIEAKREKICNLKLLRRIGIKAEREVMVNGKKITISISAESRYNDAMPADVIYFNDTYARVVGIAKNALIAEPINRDNKDLFLVNFPFEIVYRSNILTGKNSYFIENGSPAFDISLLYPGDIVQINDETTEYIFKGINRNGLTFIDTQSNHSINLTFTPLILSDSFKVIKRHAFRSSIYTSQ